VEWRTANVDTAGGHHRELRVMAVIHHRRHSKLHHKLLLPIHHIDILKICHGKTQYPLGCHCNEHRSTTVLWWVKSQRFFYSEWKSLVNTTFTHCMIIPNL
jgi:hypothetical protein